MFRINSGNRQVVEKIGINIIGNIDFWYVYDITVSDTNTATGKIGLVAWTGNLLSKSPNSKE